ncbi:MAG TPA: hypothetical protein VGP46_04460, partial [Acidimicrobiales bacterium]|nr:hypothetical protein [Acidimicrobiales bacterium]
MKAPETGGPLLSLAEALAVVQAKGTRRKRRRTLFAAAPVLVATACVIAIVATIGPSRRDLGDHPVSSSVPHKAPLASTASIVYTVANDTQDPPWALTSGAGNSVWYWDASSDSVIYNVSAATHSERAYPLGVNCCGGGVRAYPGLTVAPDGDVWAVLNHTLIELSPSSGHLSFTTLPKAPPALGAPSMTLALAQESGDLVAVSPNDKQLVVGFDDAAAIAVYRLANGTPSAQADLMRLPPGYIARDIAVLADGTIGVGMERFGSESRPEVDLIGPGDRSTQVRVLDGWGMVADGSSFLVGDYQPEFVTTSGQVRSVPADFELPRGDA